MFTINMGDFQDPVARNPFDRVAGRHAASSGCQLAVLQSQGGLTTAGLKLSLLCPFFLVSSLGRGLLFHSLVDLWVLFVEVFVRISQVKEEMLLVACATRSVWVCQISSLLLTFSDKPTKRSLHFTRSLSWVAEELLKAFWSLHIASSLHTPVHQKPEVTWATARRKASGRNEFHSGFVDGMSLPQVLVWCEFKNWKLTASPSGLPAILLFHHLWHIYFDKYVID